MKPEKVDSTVTLKGLDYVDVPALATTDYKISFFTYREGLYNAKVSSLPHTPAPTHTHTQSHTPPDTPRHPQTQSYVCECCVVDR